MSSTMWMSVLVSALARQRQAVDDPKPARLKDGREG